MPHVKIRRNTVGVRRAKRLLARACRVVGVTVQDAKGIGRTAPLVLARRVFAVAARKHAGCTLLEIGLALRNKPLHTTAIQLYQSGAKDADVRALAAKVGS
mgnify:CR=1 FL=1